MATLASKGQSVSKRCQAATSPELFGAQEDEGNARADQRGGSRRGRNRQVLLQDIQVGLVEPGDTGEVREAGSGGAKHARRNTRQADRIVFVVAEEEKLVLDKAAAECRPQAILIVTRVLVGALIRQKLIDCIQITVLKVLVNLAMKLIRAAIDDEVKLAT